MISDMTSNMDDMWEDPVLGSPLMMTRSDVPLMLSQSRHNMMIGLGALGRESSVDSPKNSLIRSVHIELCSFHQNLFSFYLLA